jgi:hypothetical protein
MRLVARPGIGEAVVSMACLLLLLATLVAVDARVRTRFSLLFWSTPAVAAETLEQRLESLGSTVLLVARERSLDRAPLLVFAAVGAVLLVFMLRT